MKLVIIKVACFALITITSMSFAEENSLGVRKVEITDRLKLKKIDWHENKHIYRIRSQGAFERLGGKKAPIDFDKQDLVVVNGCLGCTKGRVEFEIEKQTVFFSIRALEQCRHIFATLHRDIYSGHFSVNKNMDIAPYVFIKRRTGDYPKHKVKDKLKNTNATSVNLSYCGLTDADMTKLKKFKNLTHLYLGGNKITDVSLANLSQMTKLSELYLDENIGITDKGLDHLRDRIPHIYILGITGTSVTHDGLKKLQAWADKQKNKYGTQIHHSLVTPQIFD